MPVSSIGLSPNTCTHQYSGIFITASAMKVVKDAIVVGRRPARMSELKPGKRCVSTMNRSGSATSRMSGAQANMARSTRLKSDRTISGS